MSVYHPGRNSSLQSFECVYDNYGRLVRVENQFENTYDISSVVNTSTNTFELLNCDNASGKNVATKDLVTGNTTRYSYQNDMVNIIGLYDGNENLIGTELFNRDSVNRMTSRTFNYDLDESKAVKDTIVYAKTATDPMADNRVYTYTYNVDGVRSAYTYNNYDGFKRLIGKSTTIGQQNLYFNKSITYDKTRVNQVADTFSGSNRGTDNYEYDYLGRIVGHTYSSSNVTSKSDSYEYDSFGQLIRENNQHLDKTLVYEYNGIGNITSVKTYPYTTGSISADGYTSKLTYAYNNTANPDRLTNFNGKSISYNALGCPTYYDSKTWKWENGKLVRIHKGSPNQPGSRYEECTFAYDGYGRRIRKYYNYDPNPAVAGDGHYYYITNYTYDESGRLIREYISEYRDTGITTTREFIYLYDESGIIGTMYSVDGAGAQPYYYRRNLQGDVVAIYDKFGVRKVEYAYDTFGNCTILYAGNAGLAESNPIRYRGYYYDRETNLYYLNARYYNPEWRRFISPDDTEYLDPETVNGLNLYAYCNNDPVNYCDPSGHSWESFWNGVGDWFSDNWVKLAISAGVVIVGAIVTAATCGTGLGFFAAFGGALLTSAKAVAISTAMSAGIGLAVGGITTGSWKGALDGMLDGIADGFMWGGIFAGGAQIISGAFKAYAQVANHYNRLSAVKKSPFFSPDRLKNATEIAKIAQKGQGFYDYGGTIVRFGRFAHIDASTKSLLHLAALGFNHIPIGTIVAGFIGGF